MPKFKLNIKYTDVFVYESEIGSYVDIINLLDGILDAIYDLNYQLGDLVFKTSDFSYIIEEVDA